jgi:hypothetical protein
LSNCIVLQGMKNYSGSGVAELYIGLYFISNADCIGFVLYLIPTEKL